MESVIRDALRRHYGQVDSEYSSEANLIPDCYILCSRLLNDRDLPNQFRPYLVGTLGTICLPYTILENPGRNALALGYLLASVCRKIAQKPRGDEVIRRNWPGEGEPSRIFSGIIQRGNEELDEREIREFYQHVGFETRG